MIKIKDFTLSSTNGGHVPLILRRGRPWLSRPACAISAAAKLEKQQYIKFSSRVALWAVGKTLCGEEEVRRLVRMWKQQFI